ncbi:MAG: hypothetical protein ACRDT0_18045 [Pseudonocardiaceae bacterium]
MVRSHFDAIFTVRTANSVRAAVVRALRAGVRAAGESYEFGRPRTDPHTYGNDLWRFVWYEMGRELGALPGASVQHPRGSFLVDLGKAALYPFRYGGSPADDVTTCRLAESWFRRELLVDPQTQPHLFWPQVVLVPYAANPNAGLVRAYVGEAQIADGDLLDWQWLEELDVDGPAGGRADRDGLLPVPLPRQPEEPQLDLELADPDAGAGGEAG